MSTLRIPVSQYDHFMGPMDAPITLVEYGDYQCPYCVLAHPKIKELEAELRGALYFVFRHFPLTEIHPYAFLGSLAAESAGLQGKFWEMHDMIFENQSFLSPEGIEKFAESLSLNMGEFHRGLESEELANRIRRDFLGGARSGVNGTPSFFLNREKYEGPLDPDAFRQLLEAA
jgi:protein-disulfide isomerase